MRILRDHNVAGPYEHSGCSPDGVVERYPSLTLEDVHTALAYYANVEDFRDAMAEAASDAEAGTPACSTPTRTSGSRSGGSAVEAGT